MTEPYARLAELALLESRLVGDGRLDDLAPVWAERAELVASLPAVPPAAARPYLLQAQETVRGTQALLESSLGAVRDELQTLATGRRAAAGYGAHQAVALVDAVG
jgi:hypothetical protein